MNKFDKTCKTILKEDESDLYAHKDRYNKGLEPEPDVTTTEEWLITYTIGGKPHELLRASKTSANEAFDAVVSWLDNLHPEHSRTVLLYNITTQTTKTLQRRSK